MLASRGPLGRPLRGLWERLWGLLGRLGASGSGKGEKAKNIENHNGKSMILASRGPLGRPLGGLLGRLGAPSDRLEAIVGHRRMVFDGVGVCWSALGLSWRRMGPLLGKHWAVLDASWAGLGVSGIAPKSRGGRNSFGGGGLRVGSVRGPRPCKNI